MKTFKTSILGFALLFSSIAFAGSTISSSDGEDDVLVKRDRNMVTVSILNTELKQYTLFLYNSKNELLFSERLENGMSIGKRFDFTTAKRGTYRFIVKSNEDETLVKTVIVGS